MKKDCRDINGHFRASYNCLWQVVLSGKRKKNERKQIWKRLLSVHWFFLWQATPRSSFLISMMPNSLSLFPLFSYLQISAIPSLTSRSEASAFGTCASSHRFTTETTFGRPIRTGANRMKLLVGLSRKPPSFLPQCITPLPFRFLLTSASWQTAWRRGAGREQSGASQQVMGARFLTQTVVFEESSSRGRSSRKTKKVPPTTATFIEEPRLTL